MSAPGDLVLKDPDAIEPYGFDWSAWLAELGVGVVIPTSTWVVSPAGSLTLSAASIVIGGLQTQVRLTGGTVGTYYTITNHIVASDGSADDRSFRVLVWESDAPAPPPLRTLALTGLSIVTDAFAELNQFGAGDPIPADDAAFALGRLNAILDLWAVKPGAAAGDTFTAYTLTANLQPHTIGPTGMFVVGTRPARIEGAALVTGTGTSATRSPITVRDRRWWATRTSPGLTSAIPTDVYYDPTPANGALYFWPVPSAAAVVELQVSRALTGILLTDAILWPPGYAYALTKTLVEDIATPYGQAVPGAPARAGALARGIIFGANQATPRLITGGDGLPGGSGGWYDYRTGEWRA